MRELGIVIHDIFINDIGDTLDDTIFIVGVILVTVAALQFLANLILLIGAALNFKKLIPNVLLTRLCYFSTFWGSIDAYRKLLNLDEMAVFLVWIYEYIILINRSQTCKTFNIKHLFFFSHKTISFQPTIYRLTEIRLWLRDNFFTEKYYYEWKIQLLFCLTLSLTR